MKKGFQFKLIGLNFCGLFLTFILWIAAATTLKKLESTIGDMSTMIIIAGLAALITTGFIGYLIATTAIKSFIESSKKMERISEELQNQKKQMENISTAIKELESSSKKIELITETMNEIRFQVHLLALNAAIEAARAKEAGSGFNVVAEELKNLAQKTAESSKSIQDTAIQNSNSVKKMMTLADESSIAFSDIITMINELELNFTEFSNKTRK